MLGYQIPASETARQWLDKFHDEGLMSGQSQQGAFIPVESAPLAGLREPNRQVVWSYIAKMKPGHIESSINFEQPQFTPFCLIMFKALTELLLMSMTDLTGPSARLEWESHLTGDAKENTILVGKSFGGEPGNNQLLNTTRMPENT